MYRNTQFSVYAQPYQLSGPSVMSERKTYTHPTGACLDDPLGDVIVRSADGYEWRFMSCKLMAASLYYHFLFAYLPDNDPILINHSVQTVHRFLYFISHHKVEAAEQDLAPSPLIFRFIRRTVALLRKYQCDAHLALIQDQALALFARTSDYRSMFELACREEWEALAQLAMRSCAGKAPGQADLDPSRWTSAEIRRIGVNAYRALVVACEEGRGAEGIDWGRAGDAFTLEEDEEVGEEVMECVICEMAVACLGGEWEEGEEDVGAELVESEEELEGWGWGRGM